MSDKKNDFIDYIAENVPYLTIERINGVIHMSGTYGDFEDAISRQMQQMATVMDAAIEAGNMLLLEYNSSDASEIERELISLKEREEENNRIIYYIYNESNRLKKTLESITSMVEEKNATH